MRLAWLLICSLLSVPALAWAQCPGVTSLLIPFATEELTIGDTVQPLTASIYKPSGVTPSLAMVSVEGGTIRYRVVGAPSATSGHLAAGTFTICGYDNIAAFKAIRITTDALLTITYYRSK